MRRFIESLPFMEYVLGGGVVTFVFFGALFAVSIVWAIVARRRAAEDPEVKMAVDRQLDPRRGWVQGTYIVSRLHDNAYLSADLIRDSLAENWGITSQDQLEAAIQRRTHGDYDAWGLLQAVMLLRSAVAVGWLTNEVSFQRCFAVGERLQESCPSWAALGEEALRERRVRCGVPEDGSGDDEDMKEVVACVDYLRRNEWKQNRWGMKLGLG